MDLLLGFLLGTTWWLLLGLGTLIYLVAMRKGRKP